MTTTIQVEKSFADKRDYTHITLRNGLKCLLISDSGSEKSSAAMDVRVGHFSDPDDLPGLAHFCEHMLFLGTEKYPNENEYSSYLNNHGGSSNAYTACESVSLHSNLAYGNMGVGVIVKNSTGPTTLPPCHYVTELPLTSIPDKLLFRCLVSSL